VKDVIHLLRVIFIESTNDAGVLAESNPAFDAVLSRYLYFLTIQTLNLLHFLEFHTLDLTSLLELKLLIVAQLARIENFAAGCLYMT
jgi:hypothetical protein